MTIKVIGAGFGRTGTNSLREALNQLGFGPCHHMFEVVRNTEQIDGWTRAARGQLSDWDEVLGAYQSCCDWPSAAFYDELLHAYPDAKVILTVRDAEKWYDSVRETIYRFDKIFPDWFGKVMPGNARMRTMVNEAIWDRVFDGRFEDRAYALEVFHRHVDTVKNTVPADKLLVFDVAEGWGPLCRFLDVPVPDRPFPRTNERKVMKRLIYGAQAVRYSPYVLAAIVAAVGLARLL